MNILILGSGGREHALAWKISQSKLCTRLMVAPGNAGTSQFAENKSFTVNDFESIKKCCFDEDVQLLVVGPEDPLVNGLVDELKSSGPAGLMIIGPSKQAAQLEGSKAFAKYFMQKHQIPTAAYRHFTKENFFEGIDYLKQHSMPVVLKADGLAAGKGVIICQNVVEAVAEFELMIQQSKFGEAGKTVVVEEFLSGIELSVFILTDGNNYVLLPEAKDYKRIGEKDTGLNTGGMGAISPVPFADDAFMQKVKNNIIESTINGLKEDKIDYCGFIFFGLIKVKDEPYVIEYNCRMGDPETEAVIPRVQSDLVELLVSTASGTLSNAKIITDTRHAATIVAVSGGYPGDFEKGKEMSGLEHSNNDALLFHMGTKEVDGQVVTNGGRVVCATALADDLKTALKISRQTIESVQFDGKYYRRDIGYEFVS